MTASLPPDGPSRDLRERLIRALYVATWDETFEDWADPSEIEIAFTGSQVDAVLAEIAAAGFEIVASDRLDRLIRGGRHARNSCMTRNDGWMCNYPEVLERDLEPVGGGE